MKNCILFTFLLISTFSFSQEKEKVEIIHANSLEYDETLGNNAKRLIGDVKFKHKNALMYCDSAYFYTETNSMDAYGNVRIEQGDSLSLKGDSLSYEGNTQKAELRGNISLIQDGMELYTNYLDYDKENNLAYYYGGGRVENHKENTTLISQYGYYNVSTKHIAFKDSVRLTHPDYIIESDTLHYNTSSKRTNFIGSTNIKSDQNLIYCERGWYDTKTNQSLFYQNAYVYSDGTFFSGDTLRFNQKIKEGNIRCNGAIIDTVRDISIQGDYIDFFQEKDSVFVTKDAWMSYEMKDDTMYMSADTFEVFRRVIYKDDTIPVDTSSRIVGYHHVLFYANQIQGKTDSLTYITSDSVIHFYGDPVLWTKQSQFTADDIFMGIKEKTVDSLWMIKNALLIEKVDSLNDKYNQVKGDTITGNFKEGNIHRLFVLNNAHTHYYAKDNKEKYIGMNKASSDCLRVEFADEQIMRLIFLNKPEAVMFPYDNIEVDELLPGFNWQQEYRPNNREDIFK